MTTGMEAFLKGLWRVQETECFSVWLGILHACLTKNELHE